MTFPLTDKMSLNESMDYGQVDLVLQNQNLKKALKQVEKHYEYQLNKNRKMENLLKLKDQEIIKLRSKGIEALENVNKLKETIDNVNEDNTMLRDIIVEAKTRISQIQEENEKLSNKIKYYNIPSRASSPEKVDIGMKFKSADEFQDINVELADDFIFDSFSFRKPDVKPSNSGSTKDDVSQLPSHELTLTDFE